MNSMLRRLYANPVPATAENLAQSEPESSAANAMTSIANPIRTIAPISGPASLKPSAISLVIRNGISISSVPSMSIITDAPIEGATYPLTAGISFEIVPAFFFLLFLDVIRR